MATSRYVNAPLLNFNAQYGTSRAIEFIRQAIKDGTLDKGKQVVLKGLDRLDTLAGAEYGDGRYWWIVAAASNIGWGLQVPPGTLLCFPDLQAVLRIVG